MIACTRYRYYNLYMYCYIIIINTGPEFEGRIRQNEAGNPKFNFLNNTDPYHAYYQHKIKEIQEGVGECWVGVVMRWSGCGTIGLDECRVGVAMM